MLLLKSAARMAAFTRREETPSPAAIHHELRAATAIHPDAGAVPAPGAALDAGRIRILPDQPHVAAPADIHLANVVTVLRAAAGNLETLIPARLRIPSPAPPGRRKARTAALAHPHAAAIEAPGLSAHAGTPGNLLHDARVAPRHVATRITAILAF